jgi:uncharacterized protein involved in tellurium resistance
MNAQMIADINKFASINNIVLEFDEDIGDVRIDLCNDDKSHIACYLLMLQVQKKDNFDIELCMSDDKKKIIHAVNAAFNEFFDYGVDFTKHDDRDTLRFEYENDRFVCAGVGSDFE